MTRFPKALYADKVQTRPNVAIPLCKCGAYPDFEIHDGKWVLYCENCGAVDEKREVRP